MAYTDKTLQCADCGINFTFSAQDQEFFTQKGYTNEPKRCPTCRDARKTERGGSSFGGGARRQMYPAYRLQMNTDNETIFDLRMPPPRFDF